MILYFQNLEGDERIIGYPINIEETQIMINKFLDKNNYKCYYQRLQMVDDRLQFDVGSHSEFFYLGNINQETRKILKERGLMIEKSN